MSHVTQAVVVISLALGTGAATVSAVNRDIPDMVVPEMTWEPGTALDGMRFDVVATVLGDGGEETDVLVFRAGQFMSMDCQEYCDFGFTEYQTHQAGDVLHFTTTTRCPTAPHTVVWYGTVRGDEMQLEVSWTTRRWYWSHQINLAGTGVRLPADVDGPTG